MKKSVIVVEDDRGLQKQIAKVLELVAARITEIRDFTPAAWAKTKGRVKMIAQGA